MRTVRKICASLSPARWQEGFSLTETLISMVIIGIGILGFSLNTIAVIRGNYTSGNYSAATYLAQDKMEQLRAQGSLSNTDNCKTNSGDQDLTSAGSTGGIYNRCWRIVSSTLGPDLKQIDVTVSWQDYLTARQVTVSTVVFTG